MINKLKQHLLTIVGTLMLALPLGVPALASAANDLSGCNNDIANGVATGATNASNTGGGNTIVGCNGGGGDATSTIQDLAKKVVNIFSILVGAVAIIMIIYGGFRYITSGGDSGRVGNAKNTLIYALIGLVIVALAQIIVRFVLTQTNSVT
jgi:hypothetical protein